MTTYILRRALLGIPIMFLFGVVRLMPGGPYHQHLGQNWKYKQ